MEDIHDKVTTIMYQLFKDQTLLDTLKAYSKESNLVLSIDITDNTESLNVNVFKKMTKKDFIKKQLPKYTKVKKEDINDSCCICLENYTENTYKRSLSCNHHFHKKCIDKWLLKCDEEHIHCPMCRWKYELTLDKIIDFDMTI
jgi:hypothetical protein